MNKKLIIIIMTMAMVAVSLLFAAKSLERLGNEAAAEGDKLYNQEQFEQAAKKYEEAKQKYQEAAKKDGIPVDDKLKRMNNNIFQSYAKAKNYSKIIELLEVRVKEDPKNYKNVKNLAILYLKVKKDVDSAIRVRENYDKVRQSFSNRKEIAAYYEKKKDFQNAINWYENALKIKNDAKIIRKIAIIYYQELKNNEKAIAAYEDFLNTNPAKAQKVLIYKYLGKLYEDIGRINKSINAYETSLNLRYDSQIALKVMTLYFDEENLSGTLKIVEKILSNDANSADAIYYKAQVFYKQKKLKEAKSLLQKITSDPTYGANAKKFIKSIDSEL